MDSNESRGVDRRQALECMVWGGIGLVWTLSGGVPAAKIIGEAQSAPAGFSFVQISDSHIGFDKPPIPTRSARWKKRLPRSALSGQGLL
jgi:Icc protein